MPAIAASKPTLATIVWLVPLRVGTRPIGLLALEGEDVEPGTRDAIAGVTAIAIERTHLLEERKEAEVVRRRRRTEIRAAGLAQPRSEDPADGRHGCGQ